MNQAITQRYPALTYRDFRLQWLGQFVSNAGTQMQLVALNWHLYELTHSPWVLALLGASRIVPIIICSLVGGALVDAHNRKKILYVTQIVQALVAALFAITTVTGYATPTLLLLLNAVMVAIYSIDAPARTAFLPQMVHRDHYGNAVSLNIIGYNISTVTGPAIAGFLIAYRGVAWVYTIDALSFLILFVALVSIRANGAIEGKPQNFSLAGIGEGLAFVRSKTLIWSTMLLDFFSTLFAEATVLLPIFAKDILHGGPELLGLLYAAPFVGATISGVISSVSGKRFYQGKVLLWAIVFYAVGTIIFGASTNPLLSLVALALVGAGDGMSAVIRNVIRLLSTPDSLRGRMTAINMIFYMGGPHLGEVEAGIAAGLLGAPAAVVLGGIGTLLVVGLMSATIPALRTYQEK